MKSTSAGKARTVEPADDQHPLGVHRDLRGAAAARQPDLRLLVAADHGRVDVAAPIDLGAAEEAHLDLPVLQEELEDVGHRADHERAGHQRRVADRDRQPLRHRPHRARLVDQHQVRRTAARGPGCRPGSAVRCRRRSPRRRLSSRAATAAIISEGEYVMRSHRIATPCADRGSASPACQPFRPVAPGRELRHALQVPARSFTP